MTISIIPKRISVHQNQVATMPTADTVLDDILSIIATDTRRMRLRVQQSSQKSELELADAKKLETYGKIALTVKQQQNDLAETFQKLDPEAQQALFQTALTTLQSYSSEAVAEVPQSEPSSPQ